MKFFPIIESGLEPKYKMLAQPAPGYDTGDSIQREGMYMLAVEALNIMGLCDDAEYYFAFERYNRILDLVADPKHRGLIRRYPDTSVWEGQSDRLSRDQATTNVISMGFTSPRRLKAFFKAHLKYSLGFFMNNTHDNGLMPDDIGYVWKFPDLTLIGFWSLYIRAFMRFTPLLWVFDLSLVLNSLLKVHVYAVENSSNSDDLSHIAALLQSELRAPTPLSRLAMRIYSHRPYPKLKPGQTASNPAQACLIAYFRGDDPGPKLEEVFEPVTDHYFRKTA